MPQILNLNRFGTSGVDEKAARPPKNKTEEETAPAPAPAPASVPAAVAAAVSDADPSDPAIVREPLNGAGGLDQYCDDDPSADECRVFD
jgi:hypothetical protein